MSVSRRDFLQATAAGAALALATTSVAQTDTIADTLIDTNVSLGAWPFRHEVLSTTTKLIEKLRSHHVNQGWAGSFDALLHKDISSVNARLTDECSKHKDMLVPIGAINPLLPGWEEDLRRCVEVHRMTGIRLHPNYHGYKLSDPIFKQLLSAATDRKLFVQIAVIMEEERTIHPLVNVPPTDTVPLLEILKAVPQARVQLLNAFRTVKGEPVLKLAVAGVRFEIAMLEAVAGVATLLEKFPLDCLCFGSHAPFFYFESAQLKLQESALGEAQHRAICTQNALKLSRAIMS